MKKILALFLTFFKIGLFTFGGGYAMLPILQREIVEKRKWATEDELMDYFAISQCTPGVIAVNTATFVGHKKKGAVGAAFTTFGVVLPSVIIITLIATLLTTFADIIYVQRALAGIRIVVAALITSTVIKLIKKGVKNFFQIAMCVLAFLLIVFLGLSPVYIVIGAAIFGIAMGKWGKIK